MRYALIAVIGFSSGCYTRPSEADVEDIRIRQSHRYEGECYSWLRSHKTGFEYCASPPFKIVEEVWVPPKKAVDGPVTKEALMAEGEKVYGTICAACHQPTGKGLPGAYPPLAGAGEFYGDPKKMAGIVVKGINGPISVLGTDYNGAMPAQAQLSDYEIAAVTTFVRHSWGNNDGIVTPDDVKSVR